MNQEVYIVQAVIGGVPSDPEVFGGEQTAEDRYIELAKEMFGITGEDFTEVSTVKNQQSHDDDLYLFITGIK